MTEPATVFAFESDFAGSLRCIPMAVRLKLDLCGIKLSLRQWSRFAREERDQLLQLSCDTPASSNAYRDYVAGIVETRTGAKADAIPVESDPQWRDESCVPAQVGAYFAAQDLPALSLTQWIQLSPLQRFVLIKLTRPNHHNDNFLPALQEFGLLNR